MDRQWRPPPPPPPPNVCPACFHSHFPFCPPPSPFPYANPNFKRPRIDDNPISFSDDERRLKLIRDHGSHTYAPHPNHNGFPPPHNAQFRSSPHPSQRVPDGFHHIGAMQPQPPHQGNQHNFNGRVVHYPYPYPAPNDNNMEAPWFFKGQPQPPLPSSPPPPLPMEPSMNQLKTYFSPPKKPPSLFPVPEPHPMPQPYYPTAFPSEREPSKQQYLGDSQSFAINQLAAERPKVIDASRLFRHPHRASRPDHFVIILRGLPGSGKSYLAKMLRDLEVENGGDAPRIHSMDDYFMTEVEKVEDSEASKSSSSGRSKKLVTKKVMEYFYEPEMEEAYRSSMLKAFKKTVEEGVFTFIIVDDRNLRVADFSQFWATAKRSGYEVYILEATYKDPVGCAARNVHGFTQEDIEKMSKQWEEAPSLYLQLDVKSLFHGDDLKESRIQEVDMDMEDDLGFLKAGKNWDAEEEHPTEVRELGKSKWSEDYGEDDIDQTEGMKGNINALSGLIHHYGKERKSVHWGDQGGKTGFSIGAAKKVNALSLVIGPGAGYNLKSNPLPEEDSPTRNSVDSKKHSIFQEQIRAERESFKAIFDRRRHRIDSVKKVPFIIKSPSDLQSHVLHKLSARGTTRVGVRTRARTPVVEEIVPNSGWTEDSAGHYLLVDLPDFRKEEMKLQVNSYGRIVVSGERNLNEWKHVHFRLTFPAPLNSDMDKIAGKFDGGILYVTVPKQVTQQNKESETAKVGNGKVERAEEKDSHQHGNGEVERAAENDSHAPNADEGRIGPNQHDNHIEHEVKRHENEHIGEFPEQVIRNWHQESMLRSAVGVLRKNKGIVVTAVIAFSLGLFVSHKFNSTGP
ncbi:hypothetical protein JHK85_011956 [Glycine max]|nr:hypothetical protein JHK85_011956 [Glycine max]